MNATPSRLVLVSLLAAAAAGSLLSVAACGGRLFGAEGGDDVDAALHGDGSTDGGDGAYVGECCDPVLGPVADCDHDAHMPYYADGGWRRIYCGLWPPDEEGGPHWLAHCAWDVAVYPSVWACCPPVGTTSCCPNIGDAHPGVTCDGYGPGH